VLAGADAHLRLEVDHDAVQPVLGERPDGVAAEHQAEGVGDADALLTGGCSVQPGAAVEAGAVLDEVVVLPGAKVGAGAHLVRCVIAAGVMVPGGTSWRDTVVTAELADTYR